MPRVVDADARRTEIAVAALGVAREHGLGAVTFRSVAKAMGSRSTTVVTHYAPDRATVIALMIKHLLEYAERAADAVLPTLTPIEGLRLLTEAVLPLTAESKMLASLALDAAVEFGTAGDVGDELESWGEWLRIRVRDLVAGIDPPIGVDPATDALLAGLAGITLYGLVDSEHWSPDRQHQALAALRGGLGLDADGG